eukprot:s1607_g4.t1
MSKPVGEPCQALLALAPQLHNISQPSPTCIFNWGWARVQYVSQIFVRMLQPFRRNPSPSSNQLGAATPARDSPSSASSAACFLHTERCEMAWRQAGISGHEAFCESFEAKLGVLRWP